MCSQTNADDDDVEDEDLVDDDEDYDICSCSVPSKSSQHASSSETASASTIRSINGSEAADSNLTVKGNFSNERLSHYHRSPSAPAPISNCISYGKHLPTPQLIRNPNTSINTCKHNQKNSKLYL